MFKRLTAIVVALLAMTAISVVSYAQSYELELLQEGDFPTPYVSEYEMAELRENIENALLEKQNCISIDSPMQEAELAKLYEDVVNHAPRLWDVVGKVTIEEAEDRGYLIYPEYAVKLFSSEEDEIIEQAIDDILSQVSEEMTTLEKLLAVHEYIVTHYQYDYTYPIYSADCSAEKFFLNKRGVCQGYTLAMKMIMDELGIESGYATSDAMNHIWNMVELDGEWYHMDITWDDPGFLNDYGSGRDKYGYAGHDFFLLSDATIADDEHNHYDWVTSYTFGGADKNLIADSTLYDNYFWSEVRGPMQYHEGKWYFSLWYGGETMPSGICSYDFESGVIENIYSEYFLDSIYIYNGNMYYMYDYTQVYMMPLDNMSSPVRIIEIDSYENLDGAFFEDGEFKYALADKEFYMDDESGEAVYNDYYDYRYLYSIDLSGHTYEDYLIDWAYADGVLTISTKYGEIVDYGDEKPWAEYADSIKSVVIEGPVKVIEKYSFEKLAALENVVLPEGLESIGRYAFFSCELLKTINIPDSVTNLEWGAFAGCRVLENVTIPDGITEINGQLLYFCKALKNVELLDGVQSIGEMAFESCSALESINIPDGVTEIGERAFYNCTSLESIYIPASVTTIGASAFDEGIIICGVEGSYAQVYAEENGLVFESYVDAAYDDVYMSEQTAEYIEEDAKVAGKVYLSSSNDNGMIKVRVYAAAYKEGEMLGIVILDEGLSPDYTSGLDFEIAEMVQKPDCVKVFAISVEDGISPLCRAASCEVK